MLEIFKICIKTILVVLIPSIIITIITSIIKRKSIKPTIKDVLKCLIFYMYIFSVIYLTMFKDRTLNIENSSLLIDTSNYNFKLFSSYYSAWNSTDYVTWQNIILNIIMFMPLGFILGLKFKNKPIFPILISLLSTVVIEVIQLITGLGEFETDDIFNNFIGALFGYSLYILFFKEKSKILKTFSTIIVILIPSAFIGLFSIYHFQEFGNFKENSIIPLYNNYKINFTSIPLDDTSKSVAVYNSQLLNKKDLKQFGDNIINNFISKDDNTQIFIDDNYDDLIAYRGNFWCLNVSNDKSYCLIISNNDNSELSNLSVDKIKSILNETFNMDKNMLDNATFENTNTGNYTISINQFEASNGSIFDGTITIQTYSDNTIKQLEYNILEMNFYKNIDIISEQEASSQLSKYLDTTDTENINIQDVSIKYLLDTKGFYRPIYQFIISTNELNDFPIYVYNIT